jgi:hypothetical protein
MDREKTSAKNTEWKRRFAQCRGGVENQDRPYTSRTGSYGFQSGPKLFGQIS